MSEAENFVARWSRLKRDTAKEETQADAARSDLQAGRDDGCRRARSAGRAAGSWPAAGACLRSGDACRRSSPSRPTATSAPSCSPGVPAELTKAALRRVWTTDPAIRDFIGIAENQWDFTDPTAMPGFGPLEATDDVRELVAQAMGKLGQVSEARGAKRTFRTSEALLASSICGRATASTSHVQAAGMPEGNDEDGATRRSSRRCRQDSCCCDAAC